MASTPTAVSFLPSATEIVYALGRQDQLIGRTFECDYPPAAQAKAVVLDTTIPPGLAPGEIDEVVRAADGSRGLYRIRDDLRELAPDVILTQDLCGVCAVPVADVDEALATLGCDATVVSLDPRRLDEVVDTVRGVGEALGAAEAADDLATRLRARLDAVRDAVRGLPRPTVVVVEWVDPPFGTGHWIPEMVEAAGGTPLLGTAGAESRRATWDEVAATAADVLLVAPCGYYLDDAVEQAREVLGRPELAELPAVRDGRVYAVDATSVVTRPGPRVVDGVEAFASVLHPGAVRSRPELVRIVDRSSGTWP